MTRSALPSHLNDPDEIDKAFPDDNDYGSFIRWLRKRTKHWLAFSYRAKEWWARWRKTPIDIFKVGHDYFWRMERIGNDWYTSRIQYHQSWYILIQWPFSVIFKFTINDNMVYGYFPCHFDSDAIFWFPSAFIGTIWK